MDGDNLIRGFRTHNGSFAALVATEAREVAGLADRSGTLPNTGQTMRDLAALLETQSPWSQRLVVLEQLVEAISGKSGFELVLGTEFYRTWHQAKANVLHPGAYPADQVFEELLASAAFDVGKRIRVVEQEGAEKLAQASKEIEKAGRRVLQLEGVESSLMKAKARVSELEAEADEQAKLIAHLRATASVEDQEEVHA